MKWCGNSDDFNRIRWQFCLTRSCILGTILLSTCTIHAGYLQCLYRLKKYTLLSRHTSEKADLNHKHLLASQQHQQEMQLLNSKIKKMERETVSIVAMIYSSMYTYIISFIFRLRQCLVAPPSDMQKLSIHLATIMSF